MKVTSFLILLQHPYSCLTGTLRLVFAGINLLALTMILPKLLSLLSRYVTFFLNQLFTYF